MNSLPEKVQNLLALQKSTALETLGVEVFSIDEDHVCLRMPITPKVRQPAGLLHGGISMFLAETAASFHCVFLTDLREMLPVGIEINGSHLASAEAGTVEAVGRVLNRGRSLIVHEVDIVHLEENKLLTKARVTNYLKRLKAPENS
ncbi:MAG: PaaI family thioesterase [Anaerolineales bacterium]|jgi:1,4-dihydroxy-2-naphthoyl-CoA hydrolase|nr:PaaI family thioesterase [Anaerolineales bacterium]